MGAFHFLVVLSTMALASSLPRDSERNPRQQSIIPSGPERTTQQRKISEYFPDYRYPDQMVNPEFMTARCTSEGVYPHPYSCTWFYRCHDRTGWGFFYTSYFICEPGTVFDDDLDQCVPASSVTCGGEDISCMTQTSSCRSCQVGSYQQELCEFEECYSGGRPTGTQQLCDKGQLYNGQNCVVVSDCPKKNIIRNECPLKKLRPITKWTDQDSGCSVVSGCRANKFYVETLCSSFYDCVSGEKVRKTCPDSYLFSQQWKLCIIPPKECKCSPNESIADEASCQKHTGCLNGERKTQTLCEYYRCGTRQLSCEGMNQFFNPDSKKCQEKLPDCKCSPNESIADEASCQKHTGCLNGERKTQTLCDHYTCHHSGSKKFRCKLQNQLFNPDTKTCEEKLQLYECKCSPSEGIADQASCQKHTGCLKGERKNQTLCEYYKCGTRQLSCEGVNQFFNPDSKTCQEKLPVCKCDPKEGTEVRDSCNQTSVIACINGNNRHLKLNLCEYYTCDLGRTSKFKCEEKDTLFDPDTKTCQTLKTVCPIVAVCNMIESSCNEYTECDNPVSTNTITMCEKEECTRRGDVYIRTMCYQEGELYDKTKETCASTSNLCLKIEIPLPAAIIVPVPIIAPVSIVSAGGPGEPGGPGGPGGEWVPPIDSMLPPPAPIIAHSTTPPPPKTTTAPISAPASIICSIVSSSCQVHNVCHPIQTIMMLCKLERCERGGQLIGERPMCPDPQQGYDIDLGICAQKPTGTELC